MDALKKKLSSARGASIIIAMLFFFLCAMVGAVILAAASVNLERTGVGHDQNQAYLTYASAARLISDQIKDLNIKMTRKKTLFTCTGELRCELNPDYADDIVYDNPVLQTDATSPLIGQIVESAAKQICAGAELYEAEFTITADPDSNDNLHNDNLRTVPVKLYLDQFYELSVVINPDDKDYTPLWLVFAPTRNTSELKDLDSDDDGCDDLCAFHSADKYLVTETTTVTWGLAYSGLTRGGMTLG